MPHTKGAPGGGGSEVRDQQHCPSPATACHVLSQASCSVMRNESKIFSGAFGASQFRPKISSAPSAPLTTPGGGGSPPQPHPPTPLGPPPFKENSAHSRKMPLGGRWHPKLCVVVSSSLQSAFGGALTLNLYFVFPSRPENAVGGPMTPQAVFGDIVIAPERI